MQLHAAELEPLALYFDARLRLIPLKNVNAHENDETQRVSSNQRKEEQKRREAAKRSAYRATFRPPSARTHTSGPESSHAEAEGCDAEQDVAMDEEACAEEGIEGEVTRAVLKERLEAKIAAIRQRTGSAKMKKKSQQEKKNAQSAVNAKKKRRRHALQKRRRPEASADDGPPPNKKAKKESEEEAVVLKSLAFTEVKETEGERTIGKTGRKRRMAEKFRRLGVAQEQKETTDRFTQTGEGGEKVRGRWVDAMPRHAAFVCAGDPDGVESGAAAGERKEGAGRSETDPEVHRRCVPP